MCKVHYLGHDSAGALSLKIDDEEFTFGTDAAKIKGKTGYLARIKKNPDAGVKFLKRDCNWYYNENRKEMFENG